jgi:hypothetical protein
MKDKPKIPEVKDMVFDHCILESTWGPHENNNGGFLVRWGIHNFGFGTTTFFINKDGTLGCDSECCGREFVDRVLTELTKRATLRDTKLPNSQALVEENRHGIDPLEDLDDGS